MKVNVIFFFICVSFLSCNNDIEERCDLITNRFFEEIKNSKYDDAIQELLNTNKYIDLNDSSNIRLIEYFKQINLNSGKYIEHKLLLERKVFDDVFTYSFLVKYDMKFYRYLFVFYCPYEDPVLYNFTINDEVEDELKESLSLYLNYEF